MYLCAKLKDTSCFLDLIDDLDSDDEVFDDHEELKDPENIPN